MNAKTCFLIFISNTFTDYWSQRDGVVINWGCFVTWGPLINKEDGKPSGPAAEFSSLMEKVH